MFTRGFFPRTWVECLGGPLADGHESAESYASSKVLVDRDDKTWHYGKERFLWRRLCLG